MRRKLPHASLAIIIYSLSGCAHLKSSQPVHLAQQGEPLTSEEVVVEESGSFEPETLFRLMAAEMAGHRGDLQLSLEEYKRAAYETRDPNVVERAMRIASYMKDDTDEIFKLAKLWSEVDPSAVPPRQAMAMILIQEGKLEEGVEELKRLLAMETEFNYMSVVTVLGRQPDSELALKVMAMLTDDRPDDAEAQFAYAHMAARVNNQPLALEKIDQVLALTPDNVDAVTLRSHILQSLDRGEEAIDYLAKKLDGELEDDYNLRLVYGRLLIRNNRFEEARDQFERLAKERPEDGGAIYMWASTLMQLEQFDEAEEAYKQLLGKGGRETDARFQLGRIAEIKKNDSEALSWYRSVNEGQYLFPAQLQIASLLARSGDYDASLAQLDSIPVHNLTEKLNIALVKGEVLYRAGRYQEALDFYTAELTSELKGDEKLLYGRSLAAEKVGNWQQSEEDLKRILEINPESAEALNALGYSLADRSLRLDEALGYIEKAMALKPGDPAITDSMGWVRYRMGDYDQAIEQLRAALKIFYDPEIAAHLGEVLWVKGEREKALEIWNEALEKNPGHEMLEKTMKRFEQ